MEFWGKSRTSTATQTLPNSRDLQRKWQEKISGDGRKVVITILINNNILGAIICERDPDSQQLSSPERCCGM